MKKKLCSMGSCIFLMVALLCGCQSGFMKTTTTDELQTETSLTEVETVHLYSTNLGSATDYQNVEDAINAITIPEIGVQVELTFLDVNEWTEKFNMLVSGSDADLLPAFYGDYFASGVAQGVYADLTELLDTYGSDIVTCLGETYLQCTTVNDCVFAIPVLYEYSYYVGIEYDVEIAQELGLEEEIAKVSSLEDWTAILAQVHEAYPELRAFMPNGGNNIANYNYSPYDELGDYLGVINMLENSSALVNLFATEDYYSFCKLMEEWYDKGYIASDEIANTDTFHTVCAAGNAFSTLLEYHSMSKGEYSSQVGREIDFVPLFEGKEFSNTAGINVAWVIPAASEHKEAAMKLLNLMFTNSELETLYLWGVEGENYQLTSDGYATYVEGEDAGSALFHSNTGFIAPNRYIALFWEGDQYVSEEDIKEHNRLAEKSIAMGFVFDNTAVSDEVLSCTEVLEEYRVLLEMGAVDVDVVLPEFLQALKQAGIDTVIAEKQAQLDEFLEQ